MGNKSKINLPLEFLLDHANGAYTVVPCVDDRQWLAERRKSIGASEAAAVFGKSPWLNERELYESKVGHGESWHGNAATDRGKRSEGHIRELYAVEMCKQIHDGARLVIRSNEYRHMSATLDGFYLGADMKPCIMEIKSVARVSKDWQDGAIPNYYLLQVLHQLAVTGWDRAILRARFACHEGWENASERSYHFHREDYRTAIANLIDKEAEFWNAHIERCIPPRVSLPMMI